MKNSKRNLLIITVIAFFYVLLFIPVNLRCSTDRNMLLCAELDEFAQYPYVMAMTMRDATVCGTAKRVLDHKHYYYGYPFYFASAASIAPIRILSHFREANYTRAHILVLRQLSPVFMAAAIMLLVAMWTGFQNLTQAITLFFFMSAIPSVFLNNTWWHPDSMVTFFVVLTVFCLSKDDLKCGTWFFFSAIACGLAISTKVVGLFFVVSIPSYLLLGVIQKRISPVRAVWKGFLFVALMLLCVLFSYPALMFPHKAKAVFSVLQQQSEINKFGWGVKMTKGPIIHYKETLWYYFGAWPIYVLSAALGIAGLSSADRKCRLVSFLSFMWSIPFLLFLLFVVARRLHYYFLPALLPFIPLAWNAFRDKRMVRHRCLVRWGVTLLLAVQVMLFLPRNGEAYIRLLSQEQTSPSIEFYKELVRHGVLSPDVSGTVVIYRDPYIYVPPVEAYSQHMKFGSADYSDIRKLHPDLILLQATSITDHADSKRTKLRFNREQAVKSQKFYADAKANRIEGYQEVFRTDFAVAFRKAK